MKNEYGYIYILTNPSFPEYVKIGYAEDVSKRLKELNKPSCLPYSFRVYATYKVETALSDKEVHKIIDGLNPSLRCIENVDGKERKREFYAMSAEDAYSILESIATINNLRCNLKKEKPSDKEIKEEKEADDERKRALHHFDTITFSSSLTGHDYTTAMGEGGVLVLVDKATMQEVPNHSTPSKKQIIRQALIDLGEDASNELTLYQLANRLIKVIKNKSEI